MAEAYRGITIKFGAETKSLEAALKGVRDAAKNTESELRQIDKALRFDPDNADLAAKKMQLLRERTQATAGEARAYRKELEKIGRQKIDGTAIKELAKDTQGVSERAALARAEFTRLNGLLEQTKRQLGSTFMDLSRKGQTTGIDSYVAALDKAIQKLNRLQNDQDATTGQITHAKGDVTKALDDMIAHLGEVDSALVSNDKNVRKLTEKYNNLNAAQRASQEDVGVAKRIEEYKSLSNKADKLEASTLAAARAQREFAKEQYLKPYKEQLDQVRAGMQGLAAEGDRLKAAFKADPTNLNKAAEYVRNLVVQEQAGAVHASELQAKIDELGKVPGVRALAADYERLQTEIQETGVAIDRVRAEIELAARDGSAATEKQTADLEKLEAKMRTLNQAEALRGYKTELTNVGTAASKAGDDLEKAGKRGGIASSVLTNMGLSLYSTLTPAIMTAGYLAVDSADSIDGAFRDMSKTVNGTEDDFQNLKQAALDYSRTHFTSADQILEIEAMGGQLGIAADQLGAFSAVVSNLDIATDIDADTAAEELGQLNGIMPDLDGNFSQFGDSLVRLGNNSPTLESNIMDISKRISSMSALVGISTPDMLGLATAMASTGMGAEAAGTAMSNTMSQIEQAVASGGDSLQAFADVAGKSSEDFAQEWKDKPTQAIVDFIQGLKNIQDSGGSVDATLANLGITGVRQRQLLESMTTTTDMLTDSITMSNDAWNGVDDQWGAAGDAAREADRKTQGFSGTLQELKNNGQVLASEMGESLAPVMQQLVGVVQQLSGWFGNLSPEMQTSLTTALLLTAAVGPLMTNYASLKTAIQGFRGSSKAFSTLAEAQKAVTNSSSALGKKTLELAAAHEDESKRLQGLTAARAKAAASGRSMSAAADAQIAASERSVKSIERQQRALGALGKVGGALKFAGATAGIALLTAGIDMVVSEIDKYNKRVEGWKAATDGITAASNGALSAMNSQASATATLSGQVDKATVSWDDFLSKQSQHVQTMQQTSQAAAEQVSTLQQAKNTIDDYANKSNLSTQEQGALQAAIQMVNDACGTQYSVVDAVNGKIADENGVVQDTTDSIDKYIDAKMRQAKADAITQNLTEAYKAQADAVDAQTQAQLKLKQVSDDYNATVDDLNKKLANGTITQEDYNRQLAEAQQPVSDAKRELLDASEAVAAADGSIEGLQNQMGLATQTADSFTQALEAAGKSPDGFQQLADGMRMSTDELAEALSDAGVSADAFASMGVDGFQRMYDACNGDMTAIRGQFELLNKLHIDPKTVKVNDDGSLQTEYGNLSAFNLVQIDDKSYYITDNGTVLDAYGNVQQFDQLQINGKHYYVSDDGTIFNEQGQCSDLNGYVINGKHYYVTSDGTVYNEDQQVGTLQGDILSTPDGDYNISGNADDQAGRVRNLTSDINDIPANPTSTVHMNGVEDAIQKARSLWDYLSSLVNHNWEVNIAAGQALASGGMSPGAVRMTPHQAMYHWRNAPRHADGGGMNGIVSRPTMTNRGWVGEAGAEAVVPLTNRHYVMPFATTVADLMAERLGQAQQASQATVYNVYIDGARVNDDPRIREVTMDFLEELYRRAD